MQKSSLIIIGGGISGLMAAYLLCDKMHITILEARERFGGRIFSLTDKNNIIEAGPEFVHGDAAMSLELLQKANIGIQKIEGVHYKHQQGRFLNEDELEGNDWEEMLAKLAALEDDMSLKDFLDTHYSGDKNKTFYNEVTGYAQGFDVADIRSASVKDLYEEWSHDGGDDHRIPGGYSQLTDWLLAQLKEKNVSVHKNSIVKDVRWKKVAVDVSTADGKNFRAEKLLVTIPVSILAATNEYASIHFTPAIDSYRKAASDIGFGTVLKVMLEFKEPFWKPDTGFVISEELFRTWWTQLPDIRPTLTGWIGGPPAAALSAKTDEEILAHALQSLAAIYHISAKELSQKLVTGKVFNWQKDEFAKGAYSFGTLKSAAARKILNEPVLQTIFFAGEGLYSGPHPGTVEAALVTAREVAQKIIAAD